MEDKGKKLRVLERSNTQMFLVSSPRAMCDRSEWFSWCPVCDLWCLMLDQMFHHVDTKFDFQCYDHLVPYVTTTLVSHNVLWS